jgi:nitrite reductase (NO-forming)
LRHDVLDGRSTGGGGTDRSSGFSITWWSVTTALAVLALAFAAFGVFLPRGGGGSASSSAAVAQGPPQRLTVTLAEFSITPKVLEVEPGRPVILTVKNDGTMPHDLVTTTGKGTPLMEPGTSQELDLGLVDGNQEGWCSVPGHREAGMIMTFHAKGSSAAPAASDGSAAGSAASTAGMATIDFNAKPAADWKAFDPTLKPADGATEHKLTMHATEKVMEVAPGVTQEMWTFDDQVPGPTLRGKIGDVFTVTLVNDGKMGHALDFHASKVAPNVEMRTIQPGESLVYQFKADNPPPNNNHTPTPPTHHHNPNPHHNRTKKTNKNQRK